MNIEDLVKKGLSIIPLKDDKRPALKSWVKYQEEANKDMSLYSSDNIGLVCGKVSGNLLVIDIDAKYDITGTLFSDLKQLIDNTKEGLFDKMQLNATKNGGFHLIFACESQPIGNKKLASREATVEEKLKGDKVKVLLETRGEGGYICYPPTKGYKVIKEGWETLSDNEVDIVLSCCRSFNQIQEKEIEYSKKINNESYIVNPFDDYNNRGDCIKELVKEGWKVIFEQGDRVHLRRSGATDARTSGNFSRDHNKLYVFSTSTVFRENTGYSPVAVYCKLNHNDDWSACAKSLIEQGYGRKREVVPKKYAKVIRNLKEDDAAKDDIIDALRKIDGKSIDELTKVIDNYDANMGSSISTFWDVEIKPSGAKKITISYYEICRFINNELNIYRYRLDDDEGGYRYVRQEQGMIFPVSMDYIKDAIKDYIESLENYFDGIYKDELLEVLYRSSKTLFSDNIMEFLEYTDAEILEDDEKSAYFPFLNCLVKVSVFNQIELLDYKDIGNKYIWKSKIIQHNFDIDGDSDGFSFNTFLQKINNDDRDRLTYCCSLIGFLIHTWKDPLNPITVVFGEETADTKLGGGSGKGILCSALNKLRPSVTIDGKNFNPDREFAWQRVNLDTKIIFLQDTTENFDFENLFSRTTDGFSISKKFTQEIHIPFERSPKIAITTNYSVDNAMGAADRRLKLLEFSPFFSSKRKPIDVLGEVLFNSWDKSKWDKFFTMMLDCVLFYMENGVVSLEETKSSRIKRVGVKYGTDFLDWFKGYELDEHNYFNDVYQHFLNECGYAERNYSQKKFSQGVDFACEIFGKEYSKKKDPVNRKLKVYWE